MSSFKVSMDIGGTFTDIVTYDNQAKRYRATKSSTTPGELSRAQRGSAAGGVTHPAARPVSPTTRRVLRAGSTVR